MNNYIALYSFRQSPYLLGKEYFVKPVVLNDGTRWLLLLLPLEQEDEAVDRSVKQDTAVSFHKASTTDYIHHNVYHNKISYHTRVSLVQDYRICLKLVWLYMK